MDTNYGMEIVRATEIAALTAARLQGLGAAIVSGGGGLLIVGLAFGSYWAVAIAGAALAVLMVWIQGGANLIGLKSDQILSTILPISKHPPTRCNSIKCA